MTDNEYFPQKALKAPTKSIRPRKSSELTFQSPRFFVESKVESQQPVIHAIFYR